MSMYFDAMHIVRSTKTRSMNDNVIVDTDVQLWHITKAITIYGIHPAIFNISLPSALVVKTVIFVKYIEKQWNVFITISKYFTW